MMLPRRLQQHISTAAVVLGFLALSGSAQAQSSGSSSPSSTASAAPATHTVKVGFPIGQHDFQPNNLTAKVGDRILFEFYPANHSVVRMDPTSPCIPYESAGHATNEGWYTGFYPVQDASKPETDEIVIKDTSPVWFYCSAPGSCIDYQMVGVINPSPSDDMTAVKKLAKEANFALSPGEPIPDESGSNTKTSSSATPAASSATSGGGSSLSGGAIAGIVIGAVAALSLVGLLFFFVGRKKKSDELAPNANAAAAAAPAQMDPNPPGMGEYLPTYGADPYGNMPGSPPPGSVFGTGASAYGNDGTIKQGHQSIMSDVTGVSGWNSGGETGGMAANPHRLSELPSQNYDPVEIYTPGLPETPASPVDGANGEPDDRRRDTVG